MELTVLHCLLRKEKTYSAVNSSRSTLSAFLPLFGGHHFGAYPDVVRLMKGVYNSHSPKPHYNNIWNVRVVLDYCQRLGPSSELILKQLSVRFTMLLALLSCHRCLTLQALNLQNMVSSDSECVFTVTKNFKTHWTKSVTGT